MNTERTAGRKRTVLAIALIGGLTLVGLVFGAPSGQSAAVYSLAISAPFALLMIATAIVLFVMARTEHRPALMILSAVYIGASCLAITLVAVTKTSIDLPAFVPASPQIWAWVQVATFSYLAIGGVIHAVVRRRFVATGTLPPAFTTTLSVAMIAVAIAAIFAVVTFAGSLPEITTTTSASGLRTSNVGPFVLAELVAALAIILILARDASISRAMAMTLIALACEVLLALVHPTRFTLAYFIERLLIGIAGSFVLIAAVRRLFEAFRNLQETQKTLELAQRLSSRQSERLSTVWRLVRDQTLDESERFRAILDAAAAAIRPGQKFYGFLSHLEGDELVIDHNTAGNLLAAASNGPRVLPINSRAPINTTLHGIVYDSGRTIGVDDCELIDVVQRNPRTWGVSWRSFIGTLFELGTEQHFVVFTSQETTTTQPFTEEDYAFVDVIASFFSTQFHQARQLAQIRYQIEHDQLTGLPNRAQFRASVNRNIAGGVPSAIAVVDVDRFREINETFGHMIGDALLVEISAALNRARESSDVVARLAGDNFAILINDVQRDVDVEMRLRPYRSVFDQSFVTGDRTGKEALRLSASFGVSIFPQDGANFEDLLARADSAVDLAKKNRRGSVAYYNEALTTVIDRRRILRMEIAGAIADNELIVNYQPTIDLMTMDVVGAEALVRWQHPQHGVVMPDDFIPFAEQNGLIGEIGSWVMQRVLRDVASMQPLPSRFKAYINLSSHQLGDLEFVSELRDQFERYPKCRGHIAAEITETVAMQDADKTIDAFNILHDLGVQIALDDFGTGYSSLSYLKRFPIDVIKIDKSFVRGLPDDPHDVAIVETLIGIAKRFGFETLAEGIENMEQLMWLRSRGCTFGQGFTIAYPMDFKSLTRWLAERPLVAERSLS